MAYKKRVWNPKYSKMSVKLALQDALSKYEPYGFSGNSYKLIKEVLTTCDKIALEKEEYDKNTQNDNEKKIT